jgi:hypothetical protein
METSKAKSTTEGNVNLESINDTLDMFMIMGSTVGTAMVNGSKIETRYVTITPSLAQRMLDERNLRNRKINKISVNLINKEMSKGAWKFNGDSIRFDSEGILSDGQHRLMGIVESNTSQQCIVTTGLDEDTFETIDIGFKRSTSDILSINHVPNPTTTAMMVKFTYAFRNGKYSANRNTVRNLNNQEVVPYYKGLTKYQDSVNFILTTTKGQAALMSKSTLGGLHYEMTQINEVIADEFISKLITGVNLGDDSPIAALRNKLLKAKTNNRYKLTNQDMLENVVQAWNYFRVDAKVKNIRIAPDFEMLLK